MYKYQFKNGNGFIRIDSDYYFESRYVCFTFLNCEYDKDVLSSSFTIGVLGLHLTVVWS